MSEQLPVGRGFTPEELAERFVVVEATPYENPSLGFRTMVLKDWKHDVVTAETPDLNAVHLKPLGVFFGQPEGGSAPYIQVQAILLRKSITAANWLRWIALSTDRHLLQLVELSPVFADTLVEFAVDGVPFKGRAAARIDRNRVFYVFAFGPAAVYRDYAETFGVAVSSFKLLDVDPSANIESLQPMNGPGSLRFAYPASWRPLVKDQVPPGRQAVDLYNFDDEDNLNGLIRLKSLEKGRGDDSDTLLRTLKEEFSEAGLSLGTQLHVASMPIEESGVDRFINGRYLFFAASIRETGLAQELWASLFEDESFYYGVALLTPAKENQFYVWAINSRAYQLILGSLS